MVETISSSLTTVRLSPELRQRVAESADRRGVTFSAELRRLLALGLTLTDLAAAQRLPAAQRGTWLAAVAEKWRKLK